MSEPSGSSAPAKQAKQAKQPKPAAQIAADGSSSAPKGKSAKELKKEKRAAAVSARGGGAAPAGGPDGDRASAGPSDAPPNRQRPGLVPSAAAQTGSSAHIPHSQPQLRRANTQPPHQPEPATSHAQFFSHLPPHLPPDTSVAFGSSKLHPDIIRLGVLMANGTLRGANARTMALLAAFQEVIRDYECPDQADLWKDLPIYLSPMIAWLEGCRPKGVGGGNAIRWLKSEINRLGEGDERTDAEQKQWLVDSIGVYIRDRIEFADQLIAENAKEKINPGDTVVTYARSSIVERVLLEAWRDLKEQDPSASFEVVIVDSRPLNEGRRLLDSLTYAGVPCTYVLLSQLVPILQRADLILLGASALHSDGSLYSRSGTALVATLAKEHRIPVVACVETYKFGERVILDGLASNELGDAEALLSIPVNKALGVKKPLGSSLTPLSLMYDLTPPSLITAVCTEIGFIPPSSVPTVLGKAGGAA